jgi:diguanylate cyclase (GGDEF)-like protein/PAS domain S-box-containing protein
MPTNEEDRLASLQSYEILDSAAEKSFDNLTFLAAQILGTPIALICLVDTDRQWFKSHHGLNATQTSRDIAFCAHAILESEPLIVPDASLDRRFRDNPLVIEAPHIRFYAGAPLIASDGHALGTLCAIDHVPRTLTPQQIEALTRLSEQAVMLLELRRSRARIAQAHDATRSVLNDLNDSNEQFRMMVDSIKDYAVILLDKQGCVTRWNPGARRMKGYCEEEIIGRSFAVFYTAEDRALQVPQHALEIAAGDECAEGKGWRIRRDGSLFYAHVVLSAIRDTDGALRGFVKVTRDMTDQYRAETLQRQTLDRFRMASDAAGLGFWELNIPAKTLTWDDAMYKLYGRSRTDGEVSYAKWTESLHVEDREKTEQAFRNSLSSHEPFERDFRIVLPNNEIRHLKAVAKIDCNTDGAPTRVVGLNVDITDRKVMELRLIEAASFDKLTGLANRASFMSRLEQARVRVQCGEQRYFAVLFLDFDRFKLVNDTLGHEAGDELLRRIAQRLRGELRAADIENNTTGNVVSRFGGDEFLVLINDLKRPEDAVRVAERLIGALAPVYTIVGTEVYSSASIGIATSEVAAASAEIVVANADAAMYEAKRAGRGRCVIFSEAMQARMMRDVQVESSLRQAIGTAELSVVYQPIIELATGRIVSAEALLRWNHPTLGAVSPSEFIPIAEESGLIVALDEWVLNQACREMALWREQVPERAPATISVNLSRAELGLGPQLLQKIGAILESARLAPEYLQLEITEREVMRNPETSLSVMRELQGLGVKLAMDDFGTGTSSLSFLRDYPFDSIKIDRSFVQGLLENADVLAVIHATVVLVENLNMASIVEGVENGAQAAILQSLGCRYAQGYWFSRPVPAEQMLSVLNSPRTGGPPSV